IRVMILHADAVAQDRASAEWAAGVYNDYTDLLPFAAQLAQELIHQRALADARRAGNADHLRSPCSREQLAQEGLALACAILHLSGGTRQLARIALDDSLRPAVHQPLSN